MKGLEHAEIVDLTNRLTSIHCEYCKLYSHVDMVGIEILKSTSDSLWDIIKSLDDIIFDNVKSLRA